MPERKMAWLPADFLEIDYIESTVDQYIDTKYVVSSEIVQVNSKVEFTSYTKKCSNAKMWGADARPDGVGSKKNQPYVCLLTHYTNKLQAYCGLTYTHGELAANVSAGDVFDVDYLCNNTGAIGQAVCTVNGTSYGTSTFDHSYSLAGRSSFGLFSMIPYESDCHFMGKMYYFTLCDNNVEVRKMIPCINKVAVKNSENEQKLMGTAGMYDVVTGEFYTSLSATEFNSNITLDPTIIEEKDVCKVSYIESTTNQYIDTKYVVSSEIVETKGKVEITQDNSTVGHAFKLWGADSRPDGVGVKKNQPYVNVIFIAEKVLKAYCGLTYTHGNLATNVSAGDVLDIDYLCDNTGAIGQAVCTVNGTSYGTSTFDHSYSLAGRSSFGLFSMIPYETNEKLNFIGKMYYFTMYDNGTLVRDMVPCTVNADVINAYGRLSVAGTAGMYDKVTKYFYPSLSADSFVAGPEITE